MKDTEKFVTEINNGNHAKAKDLLEKILADKCCKKISDTLSKIED